MEKCDKSVRIKLGRPRASGYRSQLYILLVLREHRSLYGKEIVAKTGLHREEVWRNLKVLLQKGIIKKEKVGRKVCYSPDVDDQTLEYIIAILYEGGLRKVQEKVKRFIKIAKRQSKQFISTTKLAEKYEDELVELACAEGIEPYFDCLEYAKNWRKAKKEKLKVGLRPSFYLPNSEKKKKREAVKHPKKPMTKLVKTLSGANFLIRKMTALEAIDIKRALKQPMERQTESDPYLKEAIKKLAS